MTFVKRARASTYDLLRYTRLNYYYYYYYYYYYCYLVDFSISLL